MSINLIASHAARIVSALRAEISEDAPLGDILPQVKWNGSMVTVEGQIWFYIEAGDASGWFTGALTPEGYLVSKDPQELS